VQGWCQWQCATRQILQPLLGLPGRLPPSAALPGHFGLWQALTPLHQPTDWGLRGSSPTTPRGWPQRTRWTRFRRRGRARRSRSSGLRRIIRPKKLIFFINLHTKQTKNSKKERTKPHSSLYNHFWFVSPRFSTLSRIFIFFLKHETKKKEIIGTTLAPNGI
jgi:hypothetical protein